MMDVGKAMTAAMQAQRDADQPRVGLVGPVAIHPRWRRRTWRDPADAVERP